MKLGKVRVMAALVSLAATALTIVAVPGIGVARAEADGLHWFTANGPRSTVADGPDHAFGDGSDAAVVGNWAGPGAAGIGAVRAEGSSYHWYLSNSATAPAETNNFLFGWPKNTAPPPLDEWRRGCRHCWVRTASSAAPAAGAPRAA
jgi:hypothetical protein